MTLAPLAVSINVLYEDVRSGVLPCRLLELLTGNAVPHNRSPKNRYHYLENQSSFLKAVAAERIKLVNIGAEGLTDNSNPSHASLDAATC